MTVPASLRSPRVRAGVGGRTGETASPGSGGPPAGDARSPSGDGPRAVPVPLAGASVWVRRVGWALLALQLAWRVGYSVVEFQRFALTWDYAAYHGPIAAPSLSIEANLVNAQHSYPFHFAEIVPMRSGSTP